MKPTHREPPAAFDLVIADDLSPHAVWQVIEETHDALLAPALDRLAHLSPMHRANILLETRNGRLASWQYSDSAFSKAAAVASAEGVNSLTVTGLAERDLDGMRIRNYDTIVWLNLR